MTTHVEKYNSGEDAPITEYEMFCGAHCTVNEEADITPEDFDFYCILCWFKASCEPCKAAFLKGCTDHAEAADNRVRETA